MLFFLHWLSGYWQAWLILCTGFLRACLLQNLQQNPLCSSLVFFHVFSSLFLFMSFFCPHSAITWDHQTSDVVLLFLQMSNFFSELLHSHMVLKSGKKECKIYFKTGYWRKVVRKYTTFQNYFVSYLVFYNHLSKYITVKFSTVVFFQRKLFIPNSRNLKFPCPQYSLYSHIFCLRVIPHKLAQF